jgi:hypothetical protein
MPNSLQTVGRQSRAGLGPTAEEFEAIMRLFKAKAHEVMAKVSNTDSDELPERYRPIFSYDNAGIHHSADRDLGAPGHGQHALLPPHSPDMHKVIEHVFNAIGHILHATVFPQILAGLDPHDHPRPSVFWDAIEDALHRYSREHLGGIRKDIISLTYTYRWIISHRGERAPRGLN